MNNTPHTKIVKQIANFSHLFSRPSYVSFKAVIVSLINYRNNKQVDFAKIADKTYGAIQYFYDQAKWSYEKLNESRLKFLRNKEQFRDRTTDLAIFDSSKTVKDKNASFSNLIQSIYDGKSGKKAMGFEWFAASIKTETGKKYLLDMEMFLKDECFSYWLCWMEFAKKIGKITKAKTWVFDRGFNNCFLLKMVLDLKRIFVLRIDLNRLVLVVKNEREKKKEKLMPKKKRSKKKKYPNRITKNLKNIIKETKPTPTNMGQLWIIENVFLSTWLRAFKVGCTIIILKREKFRTPLVIVVSKKKLENIDEAIKYIDVYLKRWSIEVIFKEIKDWFEVEKFKVIKKESIYKYLHLCIFAYTLLTENLININQKIKLKIEKLLKKYRNIKELQDLGLIEENEGLKLTDAQEEELEHDISRGNHPPSERKGNVQSISDAPARYCDYVIQTIDNQSLAGLTIAVDCANGAAYIVAPQILQVLGAAVIPMNTNPDGANINEGCGATHPETIQKATCIRNADAGMAFDGDADRVIMIDEQGTILNGDHLLTIIALHMHNQGKLKENRIIATHYSNLGLDKAMEAHGLAVSRVQNGDRYVIKEMHDKGYSLGGERSGHIIIGEHSTTGDGIVTALHVLKIMQQQKKKLSELRKELHEFPQILLNVNVKEKKPFDEIPGVQEDVSEIILNIKGLVIRSHSKSTKTITVDVDQKGAVTAKDIKTITGASNTTIIDAMTISIIRFILSSTS